MGEAFHGGIIKQDVYALTKAAMLKLKTTKHLKHSTYVDEPMKIAEEKASAPKAAKKKKESKKV